jgi:hypothetical protein
MTAQTYPPQLRPVRIAKRAIASWVWVTMVVAAARTTSESIQMSLGFTRTLPAHRPQLESIP